MKKIALVAAAALTAGTLGFAAIAQDADTAENVFATADGNSDNMLSYEEASGPLNLINMEAFAAIDLNGDGWLDFSEFSSAWTDQRRALGQEPEVSENPAPSEPSEQPSEEPSSQP